VISQAYLRALRQIATRLQDTAVNWAITGSLGFALQGVPVAPHDIDLQTDAAGAYAIARLFAACVVQPVRFTTTEQIRSHLGRLVIAGIDVEVMGDIQNPLGHGEWSAPTDLARHKRLVVIEEMPVPVLSLDYEYGAYLRLGRTAKAEMLRQWLAQQDPLHARGD
jgi:hypothetical protein